MLKSHPQTPAVFNMSSVFFWNSIITLKGIVGTSGWKYLCKHNLLSVLLEDNTLCVLFYLHHFPMITQQVCLLLETLDQLNIQNIGFELVNSVAFCYVDKVLTRAWSFAWGIAKVVALFTLQIRQLQTMSKKRFISNLIGGFSTVLQKLL